MLARNTLSSKILSVGRNRLHSVGSKEVTNEKIKNSGREVISSKLIFIVLVGKYYNCVGREEYNGIAF